MENKLRESETQKRKLEGELKESNKARDEMKAKQEELTRVSVAAN